MAVVLVIAKRPQLFILCYLWKRILVNLDVTCEMLQLCEVIPVMTPPRPCHHGNLSTLNPSNNSSHVITEVMGPLTSYKHWHHINTDIMFPPNPCHFWSHVIMNHVTTDVMLSLKSYNIAIPSLYFLTRVKQLMKQSSYLLTQVSESNDAKKQFWSSDSVCELAGLWTRVIWLTKYSQGSVCQSED